MKKTLVAMILAVATFASVFSAVGCGKRESFQNPGSDYEVNIPDFLLKTET